MQPNDDAAAKAAGHDLKGAIKYFGAGMSLGRWFIAGKGDQKERKAAESGIRVPIMVVVDYRGFRVTGASHDPFCGCSPANSSSCGAPSAMPYIPVAGSLVYGSSDAGLTVHNSDPVHRDADTAFEPYLVRMSSCVARVQEFNAMVEASAKQLHLAGHLVGGKLLHAAGDVEG